MVKKYTLFVLVQVLLLLFIAVSHYAVEWYGEEVRLKTAPVDPRDILYGDYVILNYEISDVDISKFQGNQKPKQGDTVYVLLKKEGDYHQLVSAHLKKPPIDPDEQMIKGRVQYVNHRWDPQEKENDTIESVRLVYGFERYYVPEGKGKEWEEKRGQFDAVVKVAPWGQNLSRLTFIANGVITEREAQELVYEHFKKQSLPIEILHSRLENRYKNQDRPVWVMEIMTIKKQADEKLGNPAIMVIDAKTGEILP